MTQFVIRHPQQAGRYWSLYGWAPLTHSLRFASQDDAQGFVDQHGLYDAKVRDVAIEIAEVTALPAPTGPVIA